MPVLVSEVEEPNETDLKSGFRLRSTHCLTGLNPPFGCAQPTVRLRSIHCLAALNPLFDCAQPTVRLGSTDRMLKVGALSGAETHLATYPSTQKLKLSCFNEQLRGKSSKATQQTRRPRIMNYGFFSIQLWQASANVGLAKLKKTLN